MMVLFSRCERNDTLNVGRKLGWTYRMKNTYSMAFALGCGWGGVEGRSGVLGVDAFGGISE